MRKQRVLLSWSSGKDSAWALEVLRQSDQVEPVGLLTTLNGEFDRVAMHAVRRGLLEAQAERAGLPLQTTPLPWPCSNDAYEAAFRTSLAEARERLGATHIAFGDLFLEDVRAYRERLLMGSGIAPLFPLWGEPTDGLALRMVASGVRAIVTCVDPRQLPASFAGRTFDRALLDDLPPGVDWCGEAGEFHTFVCDGPMFSAPIAIEAGEVVERDGFVFADLLPAGEASSQFGESTESPFDPDGALSRRFLLARGHCCENGCRNCPYGFDGVAEAAAVL